MTRADGVYDVEDLLHWINKGFPGHGVFPVKNSTTSRMNLEVPGHWETVPLRWIWGPDGLGAYQAVEIDDRNKTHSNRKYLPTEWEAMRYAQRSAEGGGDIGIMMRLLEERVKHAPRRRAMTAPTKDYRSVSQLKQWERCPYSWYLARVLKSWQRPAAWLPQGSAVHTVAEGIERNKLAGTPLDLEQAQDLFRDEYSKEVARYTEITPNFEYWFKSGPYAGAVDVERRYGIGLGQVEKFIRWDEAHPEEVIWIAPPTFDPRCSQGQSGGKGEHVADCECRPDGTPGIELAFDIELDGILVRGYIDAVQQTDKGIVVVDYKTGNQPGDDFQLAVYAVAIAEAFGVPAPKTGTYWMGKSGKPTYPYDLTDWTRERVSAKFQELDENIRLERFDPLPSADNCNFCSVSLACEYREG